MCENQIVVLKEGTIGKNGKQYYDDVKVGCGYCLLCRKRKLQEWSFRLQQEEKISTSSHFVTLTYNTKSVPITNSGFMTLEKTHLQKYFKRLRKRSKNTLKYYAVGEYGTQNKRPHYHIILFNSNEYDIRSAWYLDNEEIGDVHIGKVSEASIAYTLKYVSKKQEYIPNWKDINPPFKLSSTNMGLNYLTEEMKQYHKNDIRRNYVMNGPIKVPLSRYYRERIYDDQEKAEQAQIIQKVIREKRADIKKSIGNKDYDLYIREKIKHDTTQRDIFNNNRNL